MRRVLASAAAGLLALSIAACTSSHDSAPSSGSHASSAAPAEGLSQAQARAALLTAKEVGGGLTVTSTDHTQTPFPCTPDAQPLDRRVPPAVQVETTFADDTDQFQVSEQIDNYGDEATVAKALALGEQGLACKEGTVRSGTGTVNVVIDGPIDLASSIQTPVDKVEGWSIGSIAARESIIVARMGTQLVVLTFGVTAHGNQSTQLTAAITARALAKVHQATG